KMPTCPLKRALTPFMTPTLFASTESTSDSMRPPCRGWLHVTGRLGRARSRGSRSATSRETRVVGAADACEPFAGRDPSDARLRTGEIAAHRHAALAQAAPTAIAGRARVPARG